MKPLTQPQKNVTVIEATQASRSRDIQQQHLRVCAYCRVSTNDEEQLSSYQSQITYYTNKISENPNWKMAGIFADEGVSGTSIKKRVQFNKMIQKCKRGRIDLILTKSISRFARNTLDCIEIIRKLRHMGVGVVFEKEGINTLDEQLDETMLTIMCSLAQAESESQSRNVRLGFRQSFRAGKVPWAALMGYRKNTDGEIEIVPEQALIVKRIFQHYLAGSSARNISNALTADRIQTLKGCSEWKPAAVLRMLQNEKYIGDVMLQKTYVADMLTRTVRKNRGELPKYYVENNHPAIIDRYTFQRVQEEMARRASIRAVSTNTLTDMSRYSGKYALTERLVCGSCGRKYRRVTWIRPQGKKIVWRCLNRVEHGKKYCRHSPSIEEWTLHSVIREAINEVVDRGELQEYLQSDLRPEVHLDENRVAIHKIRRHIEELDKQTIELIQQSAQTGAECDAQIAELYMEQSNLASELRKIEIHEGEGYLLEYDDHIVRWLVESVTVVDMRHIHIKFTEYGLEMEVTLDE